MHHHADPTGWLDTVNTIANIGIIAGYVIVPFTVLRRLPLTAFVRVAGIFFFLGCALTHLHMAAEHAVDLWLAANHIVQAAAVWCFVVGFARLVTHANRRRAQRGGDPAKAPR